MTRSTERAETDVRERAITGLELLVTDIACSLVGDSTPRVTTHRAGDLVEYVIDASPAGRIIGKQGRTIQSIRNIARAVGARDGIQVNVRTLDDRAAE